MTSPPMPDGQAFQYELRIPKDRIAVLIGPKGKVKADLQRQTKSTITVDSKEGEVTINGKEVLSLYQLRDIVKAIGRGFNPDVASLLLRQDYNFELIDLNEYNKHKNHQLRLKGRVIGKAGKTREIIEHLTEVNISVYGKTIGIIGTIENVGIASRAIDMILSGSPHATVYKWLEQKAKQLKRMELIGPDAVEIKDEFKKYMKE